MDPISKIKGSIYGYLIGNALATRCQGKTINHMVVAQQLARRYTDVGAMMLSTMSSIVESERIDIEDIAFRLYEWYIGGYLASGEKIYTRNLISQAFRLYNSGMPADRCGSRQPHETDNTALLRMLPIALWDIAEPLNTLVADVKITSKFTNQQEDALNCSALYAIIVRTIFLETNEKASALLQQATNSNLSHLLTAPDKIHGTSEILDSFWSTIKIYAKYGKNYESAITEAICLGGDTEATASLVGSLTGLSLGFEQIPQRWVEHLELSLEANEVIKNFIKIANNRYTQRGSV